MTGVVRWPVFETVTSDTSGSWGYGAYLASRAWFQLKWPKRWEGYRITVKELLPIVLAVAMWGSQWQDKSVRCRCDNAAMVAILRWGWCKNKQAMHLLRSLYFFQAAYQIKLILEHIRGSQNELADVLSCDNHLRFLSGLPVAPSMVNPHLKHLLAGRIKSGLDVRSLERLTMSILLRD